MKTVAANFKVVDEVCNDDAYQIDDVNLTEEGDKIADSEPNAVAEEVEDVDKMVNDCDVYIIRYLDNQKSSEAQEAVNYIEDNLKMNFMKNKVTESDQVFKICDIEILEENAIQVKVKMKKNNWPVELSARNLQTSRQDDLISVSIKSIQR